MGMMEVLPVADVRRSVSDVEWQTRVELAACYRLVAAYGMTDLIYNHISARIPGQEEHYLINPYGMLYCRVGWPVHVYLAGSCWPRRPSVC